MANSGGVAFSSLSKYKISRRGRKLLTTDDQKILAALPKDVPEKTWAEVLQKEDNELFILSIREDIVQRALDIGYDRYMDKQTTGFTVHCAAQAWLRLIDWQFYRHDPGEDPSAYPPCYIPNRATSWKPDVPPDVSPKDTWCKHDLPVLENESTEASEDRGSATSLELPVVEEIPSEYWFPGKVHGHEQWRRKKFEDESRSASITTTYSTSEELGAESEVLQKVTDYSTEEMTSSGSGTKTTAPVNSAELGAGEPSAVVRQKSKARRHSEKSKLFVKTSWTGRSRGSLPPLDDSSVSRASIICDCRLRSLRLDTNFEISSEKIESLQADTTRRK